MPQERALENLKIMAESSKKLKKHKDSVKFGTELLKIRVKQYNQKEIDTFVLLRNYFNLIQDQIDLGDYDGTMKTFEKLKLYSLDGFHARFALESLNKDGFNEKLPLNESLNDKQIPGHVKDEMLEKYMKDQFSNCDKLLNFFRMVQCYLYVAKLSWLKYLCLKHYNSKLVAVGFHEPGVDVRLNELNCLLTLINMV